MHAPSLFGLVLLLSPSRAEDLLLLGNSYTEFNQLDVIVAALFDEGQGRSHSARRLTAGGLTFTGHLERVEGGASGPGPAWAEELGSEPQAHGWVLLQEQSQIPGFPDTESTWLDSRTAAVGLDAAVAAHEAQTVFFMTWGRRQGDADNPSLYPDFSTMQARLTDGYLGYVAATSTGSRPTWVAPVGPAFALAHEQTAADKGDPLDPSGLFWNLYDSDGSHPSPAGSYLAACVIYATVTGDSPVGLDSRPAAVDAALAAQLQELARRTVFEETEALDYPWETVDTGGSTSDGGASDGATSDGGASDGGASDGGGAAEEEGKGCSHGPGGAIAALPWVVLGALGVWRRRRGLPAEHLRGQVGIVQVDAG